MKQIGLQKLSQGNSLNLLKCNEEFYGLQAAVPLAHKSFIAMQTLFPVNFFQNVENSLSTRLYMAGFLITCRAMH